LKIQFGNGRLPNCLTSTISFASDGDTMRLLGRATAKRFLNQLFAWAPGPHPLFRVSGSEKLQKQSRLQFPEQSIT
jgi:hypothetical protein